MLSEFEWTIEDRVFEPCEKTDWGQQDRCGSTVRLIRFVPTNSGKKLVCANDHNHAFEGNAFIPAEEFGPGGSFEGVLPAELQPSERELRELIVKRWKISRESKNRLDSQTECASCLTPPFPVYRVDSHAELWDWIAEHDRDLLAKIHARLRESPGTELADWYASIPTDLRSEVMDRINMSLFHVDHGVPRKIANLRWALLSRSSRRFLQRNLLFALCRKCNGSKSSRLIERDRLVEMYVQTYYDGSRAAAIHDLARWKILNETLDRIYEARIAV